MNPWDLSEAEEYELVDELEHRLRLREAGLCDYCGRRSVEQSCKFPHRHNAVYEYPPLEVVGEVEEAPPVRRLGRWARRPRGTKASRGQSPPAPR